MPHIRDGELHAWLDGALDRLGADAAERVRDHLSRCADCRARLEEEGALRAEASELLDGALMSGASRPPFEELMRRAEAGPAVDAGRSDQAEAAPRRDRRITGREWAWAASVVLALGTGWMMGGGSLEPERIMDGVVASAPAPEAEPAASIEAEDLEAIPFSDQADRQPEPGTDGLATRPTAVAEEEAALPQEQRRQESPAAQPVPAAAPPEADLVPPRPNEARLSERPADPEAPRLLARASTDAQRQDSVMSENRLAAEAEATGVVGQVVDAASGAPLPGVQVSVQGTGAGALTDDSGRFSIQGAFGESDTVQAELLGYAKRTVPLGGARRDALRVPLEQTAIALDEIVVTGTQGSPRRRALGASVGAVAAAPTGPTLAHAVASDGAPAFLPGQLVLETHAPAAGHSGAMTQQLAGGARVLIQWTGDEAVAEALTTVDAAANPIPEEAAAWPTQLRLVRGSALVVVRSELGEEALRRILAQEGWPPTGGS